MHFRENGCVESVPVFHWSPWGFFLLVVAAGCAFALGVVFTYRKFGRAATDRERDLTRKLEERAADHLAAVERAEEAHKRLKDLIRHDALTGLTNRTILLESFATEWRRCRRDQKPLSILFFAVDFFEEFDATYGSEAGDECLRRVAAVLSAGVRRAGDVAARWGGEGFVVLLPSTDPAGAEIVARRLMGDLDLLAIPHNRPAEGGVVSMSVGVATELPGKGGGDHLLESAEGALRHARSHGGRQMVSASPEPQLTAGPS
jgi:diguanylate cyclase (GGDEF)-like protein